MSDDKSLFFYFIENVIGCLEKRFVATKGSIDVAYDLRFFFFYCKDDLWILNTLIDDSIEKIIDSYHCQGCAAITPFFFIIENVIGCLWKRLIETKGSIDEVYDL